MIICAFENPLSIPSFLVMKIAFIGYDQLKKNDSFSFYLSIAMLLVFLYLIAVYASVRECAIIICWCPQNIIEISLSRKNVHRNMLSKMPEM
jgi:multidrug efflux pump subunit AcrB